MLFQEDKDYFSGKQQTNQEIFALRQSCLSFVVFKSSITSILNLKITIFCCVLRLLKDQLFEFLKNSQTVN